MLEVLSPLFMVFGFIFFTLLIIGCVTIFCWGKDTANLDNLKAEQKNQEKVNKSRAELKEKLKAIDKKYEPRSNNSNDTNAN